MPRRQSPWLGEAVDAYLPKRARDVAASVRDDRYVLGCFARDLGNRRVASIRAEEWTGWLATRARRLAPSTTNRDRSKLLSFWQWCQGQGWTGVEWVHLFPPLPLPQPDKVFLRAGELLELLDYAHHPRDRALLAVAMNSALRIGEVCSLRVNDLDLDRNRLRVEISKKRRLVVDYLKLSAELRIELETWLDCYRSECGELDVDWYLTPAKTADLLRGGETWSMKPGRLKPAARISKAEPIIRGVFQRSPYDVPKGQGWHVLRRSVAHLYFEHVQTTAPYADALGRTQALLHHASRQTTEIYLDLTAAKAARDADLDGQPLLTRLAESDAYGKATRNRAELRPVR